MIYIVTNSLIRAQNSEEAGWIRGTCVALNFISRVDELLALPDGARLMIINYRTGATPGDICDTARAMIRRGNFEEFKV